jgi:DNA-binding SARP family transcriptional activator
MTAGERADLSLQRGAVVGAGARREAVLQLPTQRSRGTDGLLRVTLFGGLRVLSERRTLEAGDFPGQKPKQLLEALLCHRGHSVSKDRLAELLWPEAKPRNHVATLETYVSVLRRTIEPHAATGRSVVVTERGGYRIGPAGLELDLDVFDELVGAATSAPPAAALDCLRRALRLVRGDVLEDEPYARWAESLRETYRTRHVQALVDAGRLALVVGDAPVALELARQAVELNPLGEPGYQVLMTAAYSLWRQDEALAAFERCRRLLAEELGAEPLAGTTALHLAILRHEAVAELMPVAAPAECRRDAPALAPAATVPLLGRDTVPLLGRDTVPLLGRDTVPLLGRDAELGRLREAARRAAHGSLTLAVVTGTMGMGKTRLVDTLMQSLAVPVAANRCSELEPDFPYLALALALRPLLGGTTGQGLPALTRLMERAERGQPLDQFARLGVMEALAVDLSRQPPFVLWLDDAQWADRETVTTLNYLQRRCAPAPILIVLSYDRARERGGALRRLRPDLRIDLGPLPAAALQPLGDDRVAAATGGHPMFVEGWLRARRAGLDQPFPADLCQRLVSTCWDIGPQAYRLLGVASVLPDRRFSRRLLSALVGVEVRDIAADIDQLLEHGLLTGFEELAFSTPAVRSILADTLSAGTRTLVREQADHLHPTRATAS